MVLIAYLPVAAGSPGPFDKKIPSGFNFEISSAVVLQETTFTNEPEESSSGFYCIENKRAIN